MCYFSIFDPNTRKVSLTNFKKSIIQIMELKEMFQIISYGVKEGESFESLKSKYPLLTKPLYIKLGGVVPRKTRFNKTSGTIKAIVGLKESEGTDCGVLDEDLVIGTLLGDGHIEQITNNVYGRSSLYRTGHCWAQVGYVKVLYELLRPFSSALTLKAPQVGLQDWSIHFTTVTSPKFNAYRDLFYTQRIENKNLPQKNVMTEEILKRLTWRALAFWIMDDGKRYGTGRGRFAICIGKQPHYTEGLFYRSVEIINDVLGVKFDRSIEKGAYIFRISKESSEKTLRNLLPHVWPDFNYKFNVKPEECGEEYRSLEWFREWEESKRDLEHPFLELHSYREYKESSDPIFKMKFERALFRRVRVRGFPYVSPKQEDLPYYYDLVIRSQVKNVEGVLSCTPLVNVFCSSFMRHRFHCKKKKNRSPYQVFLDNKKLLKVLKVQLKSGPNINDSNIRNAIATYGASGMGQFNTGVARYFVSTYCTGDNVLDPCSGWGNRLTGTAAAGKNYYGIEPSTQTYDALVKIKEWILSNGGKSTIDLVHGVAEDPKYYRPEYFDFCLTSPPYFDLEEYSEEPTQSFIKYSTLEKWQNNFLRPFIANVYSSLKPNSVFVLSIADTKRFSITPFAKQFAESCGFVLEKEYQLKPFLKPGMLLAYSEPIYVFRKG